MDNPVDVAKVAEGDGIKVLPSDALPPRSMVVSRDIWEDLMENPDAE